MIFLLPQTYPKICIIYVFTVKISYNIGRNLGYLTWQCGVDTVERIIFLKVRDCYSYGHGVVSEKCQVLPPKLSKSSISLNVHLEIT